MKISETGIKNLMVFDPQVFEDDRGYFYEGYSQNKITNYLKDDFDFNIVQFNFSKSRKGVLRGLHFQKQPFEQAKLVNVLKGEAWDVAVDLRPGSATYGKWHGEMLTEENKRRMFIPRGFAHGFIALTEGTELMYAVDNGYNKESEGGIIYNDPSLNIDWKMKGGQFILSEKDLILPTLE